MLYILSDGSIRLWINVGALSFTVTTKILDVRLFSQTCSKLYRRLLEAACVF
jgi:hypothetical protein